MGATAVDYTFEKVKKITADSHQNLKKHFI
jgi:hypothetical protein